jgi:hypothetical protein
MRVPDGRSRSPAPRHVVDTLDFAAALGEPLPLEIRREIAAASR